MDEDVTDDEPETEPLVARRTHRAAARQAARRETTMSADSGRPRGQPVDSGGAVRWFTGRERR